MLDPRKIGTKTILSKTISGLKIFLIANNIDAKYRSEKNFRSKIICHKMGHLQKFGIKKMVKKKFGPKNHWFNKITESKIKDFFIQKNAWF